MSRSARERWGLKATAYTPQVLNRPRPSNRWHLDEMVVRIAGERMRAAVRGL
jgi:transposase-like protein